MGWGDEYLLDKLKNNEVFMLSTYEISGYVEFLLALFGLGQFGMMEGDRQINR